MAPSDAVASTLANVSSASDKASVYESLLQNITGVSSPPKLGEDLGAIIASAISQSLGVVATRAVLTRFVTTLTSLASHDVTIAAGTLALDALAPQHSSFIDQAVTIRELMATAHEGNEDFSAAAKILAEIPLESSQRKVSAEDKARIWIRITRNYLEEDESTAADTYVNKLKTIMYEVTDPDLILHFKLSQARVQDAKRDFLTAATRYHDISMSTVIAEEERLHTLAMAIKCAVLAPAGPLRSRTLGKLFRDERSVGLEEYSMLEKMFLERILSTGEVEKFSQKLQPHQLATTSDGSTVLQKAVIEHNVLAVSRLYNNISLESLAERLGLGPDKAEETVARMIEQGRLVGSMDQLESWVFFEGGEASGVKGSGRAEVPVGKEIRQWDANIQGLSEEVENITNALQKEFPEFVAANLVA